MFRDVFRPLAFEAFRDRFGSFRYQLGDFAIFFNFLRAFIQLVHVFRMIFMELSK